MNKQYTWRGIRYPPIEDRRLSLRSVRSVKPKPVLQKSKNPCTEVTKKYEDAESQTPVDINTIFDQMFIIVSYFTGHTSIDDKIVLEQMTKISLALLSILKSMDRADSSWHENIRQNVTICVNQMKMCDEECELMLSSERFANLLRALQNPFKCNCGKRFCKTFLDAILLKEDKFHQAVKRIVKIYQLSNAEIGRHDDQSKMIFDLVECIVKKLDLKAEQEKKELMDLHTNMNIKHKNKIQELQIQLEKYTDMRSRLEIEFEKRAEEKHDSIEKDKQQIENKLLTSQKEIDALVEEREALKRELKCLQNEFKEKDNDFNKLEKHYRKLKVEKEELEHQNHSLLKQVGRGPVAPGVNRNDNYTTSTNKDRNANCTNRKKQESGKVTENLYTQPSSLSNTEMHVTCTNLNIIISDQSNDRQKSALRISSRDTRRESQSCLHSHDLQSLPIQSQKSIATSHPGRQRLHFSSVSRDTTFLSIANPDTDDDDD